MPYPLFLLGLRAIARRQLQHIEAVQAGSGLMGTDVEILTAMLEEESGA